MSELTGSEHSDWTLSQYDGAEWQVPSCTQAEAEAFSDVLNDEA